MIGLKLADIILAILLGVLAVYLVHTYLVMGVLLDAAIGADKAIETPHDKEYHDQYIVLSYAMLIVYFLVGLLMSLLSIFAIRSIRRLVRG